MPTVYRFIFVCILCTYTLIINAQIAENFSDGDFTGNPAWTGNTADWTVNAALQLQSNNTVANSTFYLSTANTLAVATQWDMSVQLAFNTSSANYVDAYLTASDSNLTGSNTTGYFIRMGNTDDEISLYRKDAGGAIVKIIDGANGILNATNNVLKIRVICTAANNWTLLRDITGTGTNYITEGIAVDASYTSSAYFGYVVKQSTSSFFQKHFFDDIEVKAYVPDVTPPAIQSVTVISPNSVDILFSEAIDAATGNVASNYVADNAIGSPVTAVTDAVNIALVHLSFGAAFPNGTNNTITISNINDLAGNTLNNGSASFSFYTPQAYNAVIDEILADPTPIVGLPNAEFIEVKNTSGKSINLQGWRVYSLSTASAALPSYVLPADSFLILTGTASVGLFAPNVRVLGIASFPSLDNTGTTIWLTSKEGVTIHSVSYNIAWFQNDVKSNGGWSLEMVDTHNFCSGLSNWKASTNLSGGTPGAKNSVDAANPDAVAPTLIRAAATDSLTLLLTFSEPVDIAKAAMVTNYSITEGINMPLTAVPLPPSFNQVQLTLNTPVTRDKVYTIAASGISDCSGNLMQAANLVRVGLPSVIDSADVVINEILFNPKPGSVDYVELYNRSGKVFNLKDLYIANRSSTTNALGSLQQLSAENILLFPGDFFVVSENGAIVKQNYLAKNPDNFSDIPMPSFSDDEGVVVLLNAQGVITDELHYDEKWHFALIDNEEGISLERLDYNKPTQNKDNWHSAASTVGFGTPSYQNSQFRANAALQGGITVTPKTFSPDNDGFEDYTTLNYQVSELGYVANITIFDAAGRAVKSLAKNATLALTGSFRWDGLNDKFSKVAVGPYVIYTEIFNLNGKKKAFKNTVVVAARF